MNKKKIITVIVVLLIIIVVAVIVTMYFMKRAKYVYDIEQVTNIEYNTINIDNR